MDSVTTAAVGTAVISAAGTVLAAWIQSRTQRSGRVDGQQPADSHESGAEVRAVTSRESRPDDCR
jgi:phage tail tape-measure protein